MELSTLTDGSSFCKSDPGEFAYDHSAPRISVTHEEARILERLARGCLVLEIGTGLGVSTRAMAKSAKRLITVDNDPWVHAEVWPGLHSVSNIETHGSIDVTSLNSLRFDTIFIDGDHRPESILRDIESVEPFCGQDTLLVFHDVNYPRVFNALIDKFPAMQVLRTSHGIGLAWSYP